MLVLIDADPVVYRCGFAAEKPVWHIVYEDSNGEPQEIEFTADEKGTANEYMQEWLTFNDGKITVLSKDRTCIPDPVSYALRAVKVQVESIISECEAHLKEGAKMLMWISGGANYRDKIATIRPYKGNRDPTHKPYHYAAIRDYLRTHYGAYITSKIEADDAVSIYARTHYERTNPETLVIATIDKDLDQIPGQHYNYMQKVFYAINQTEAERFFIYQILRGDPTDNIVGCWKCGDAAASRIIAELEKSAVRGFRDNRPRRMAGGMASPDRQSSEPGCPTAGSGSANPGELCGLGASAESVRPANQSSNARESRVYGASRDVRAPYYWAAVISEYRESQRKAGCPYAASDPEAVAIEMAQLVKLQEYPGQLWHPHGDLVVPDFIEGDFDG